MNAARDAAPLPHVPTGFPRLDHYLDGGYPTAAISAMAGTPHAARILLARADSPAGRTARLRARAMAGVRLWAAVAALIQAGHTLILVEGVSTAQVRALPAALMPLLARYRAALVMSVARLPVQGAALNLRLTPSGWIYRQRRVTRYRVRARAKGKRGAVTLLIPLSAAP